MIDWMKSFIRRLSGDVDVEVTITENKEKNITSIGFTWDGEPLSEGSTVTLIRKNEVDEDEV